MTLYVDLPLWAVCVGGSLLYLLVGVYFGRRAYRYCLGASVSNPLSDLPYPAGVVMLLIWPVVPPIKLLGWMVAGGQKVDD